MKTLFEYLPDFGIKLNSTTINWNSSRNDVRKLVGLPFKEFDSVLNLDSGQSILSRRDIYENIDDRNNSFFFGYNAYDELTEIEIHRGSDILVNGVKLDFKKDIQECIWAITKISDRYIEIEPGNYLFPNLKLAIADEDSMGGEGHDLSYFYASIDIQHLMEEY